MLDFSSRIAVFSVSAVVIGAGLAGCGGSDSDSSDALSKDDYIAQADQICADSNTASNATTDGFTSAYQSGDYDTAADLIAENGVKTQDALDELAALTPPEEDQAQIDAIFALSDRQQDLVPDFEDAVRAGDDAGVQAVAKVAGALDKQSDALADEYGFVDCGSAGNA